MVVSTAPHLRESYQLWKRFSLPTTDGGTRDAYSVPNYVASQLNSAYTIMVTSMVMNLWCILFAIAFFLMLKRGNNKPHVVSTSLWNKRSSLTDSFLELIQPSTTGQNHWKQWWIYPAIFVVVICWIAQNVLSIIVPPYILIGNAAPVNPSAIFAPPSNNDSPSENAQLFSLDVPAALRAVGSAQVASKDVLKRTSVTQTDLGKHSSGETITRIDYNYTVSGADMGLQYYPTLLVTVTGACTTEYGWLTSSDDSQGYTNDTYSLFGNTTRGEISLNLFDGPAPVAFFHHGPVPPSGPPGNRTWAAYISSVDRVSFTPGKDPIYATGSSSSGLASTGYAVQPKRPVLSCWQRDEWTYHGHSSTVTRLNNTLLPGLHLSPGMQLLLARYLGTPKIVDIGRQLGLSALVSSTTSLGSIFDAGSSGAFPDLQRLVLAAYIATTNTLTDLTLYAAPPTGADGRPVTGNLALDDEAGKPKEGVADFVIWDADVSTLSIKALIIIPALSLCFWLLALGLLSWSPLQQVNSLDAVVLHRTLVEKYPDARPHMKGGKTWRLQHGHDLRVVVPVEEVDPEAQTGGVGGEVRNGTKVVSKQTVVAERVKEVGNKEESV